MKLKRKNPKHPMERSISSSRDKQKTAQLHELLKSEFQSLCPCKASVGESRKIKEAANSCDSGQPVTFWGIPRTFAGEILQGERAK